MLANSNTRLTLLFVVSYLACGISSHFGLIAQPIQYFMMKGQNMNAAQASASLAVLMLPWVLKPLYGLISDFVPLFGYRRKSYLLITNLISAVAFIGITFTSSMPVILAAVVFSSLGMAASTAITAGMAIEAGRAAQKRGDYFSVQVLYYYIALSLASVTGGQLCQAFTPTMALHTAAIISAVPVIIVAIFLPVLLQEEKTSLDLQGISATWKALNLAFRSRRIWFVALFIWFWNFSPSFGVPLYFYESNNLGFSQSTIGRLSACTVLGQMTAVPLYWTLFRKRSARFQLLISVSLGTLSTLAYVLLSSPASAAGLEFFRGVSNIIALLSIYNLVAVVCPKGVEVSVMACMLAVWNLATDASTFIGGQLFTHVFNERFSPLVLVAAAATAFCALFVPLLSTNPEEVR